MSHIGKSDCTLGRLFKFIQIKQPVYCKSVIRNLIIVIFTIFGLWACGEKKSELNNLHKDSEVTDILEDQEILSDADADGNIEENCMTLETKFLEIMEEYAKRGMVVGISSPECGRWIQGTGIGDPDHEILTTDLFRIASVTKTFTAATVLKLIEEGSLALDDTIDMYIGGAPNGYLITIKNLLNHTSGLFDIINDADFMEGAFENPAVPFSPEELLAVSFSHDPLFTPGTSARYCNSNYHVLGSIIEIVTGKSASESITSKVITPLSLSSTVLEGEPPMTAIIVPGYSENGVNLTSVLHPTLRWTAGAVVTSVEELLTWC